MKLFFFISFFTASIGLWAFETTTDDLEVVVYQTYEDYLEEKGEIIGAYVNFSHLPIAGRLLLKVELDNTINEVEVQDSWGYSIGDKVFRVYSKKGALRIISKGKYIYYEHGIVHMRTLHGNGGWTSGDNDWTFYSKELNSKILTHSNFMKEKKSDPSLVEFCDCVKDARKKNVKFGRYEEYLNETRECVKKYN